LNTTPFAEPQGVPPAVDDAAGNGAGEGGVVAAGETNGGELIPLVVVLKRSQF
jgi:hypothetical protein